MRYGGLVHYCFYSCMFLKIQIKWLYGYLHVILRSVSAKKKTMLLQHTLWFGYPNPTPPYLHPQSKLRKLKGPPAQTALNSRVIQWPSLAKEISGLSLGRELASLFLNCRIFSSSSFVSHFSKPKNKCLPAAVTIRNSLIQKKGNK